MRIAPKAPPKLPLRSLLNEKAQGLLLSMQELAVDNHLVLSGKSGNWMFEAGKRLCRWIAVGSSCCSVRQRRGQLIGAYITAQAVLDTVAMVALSTSNPQSEFHCCDHGEPIASNAAVVARRPAVLKRKRSIRQRVRGWSIET